MVGRWSVGGRPTTYRPPFYGAACSRLPSRSHRAYACVPKESIGNQKDSVLDQGKDESRLNFNPVHTSDQSYFSFIHL